MSTDPRPFDREKIETAVRMILEGIGEDPDREGLRETPARVARMYEEICRGIGVDARELVKVFTEERYDELVLVKDIPLYSLCVYGKSMVYTPEGAVFAREVLPGDRLLTIEPEGKRLVETEVLAVSRTQHRERYRVSFDDGSSLVVTGEHPLYTLGGGFVPARELRTGEPILGMEPRRLCRPSFQPEAQEQTLEAVLAEVTTKVRRIQEIQREVGRYKPYTMYNFECAPHNSFLANGVLTHNCEHHLLPFIGTAHVGYIPEDNRVTGLSKIPRIVDTLARKPQVQERLTVEIADVLMESLRPQGVIVVIEAEHLCLSMRGVQKPGTRMRTSVVRGIFRRRHASRDEALRLMGY